MPKETTKNSMFVSWAARGTFALAGIASVTVATLEVGEYLQKKQVIDCDIDGSVDAQDPEQVEKCRTYIHAGKIALIGFDAKASQITYVVDGTEEKIKQLFGSAATIDVIVPNTALQEEYESHKETASSGKPCVSNKHFLSDAARQKMTDDLKDYNVVIAYTSLPGCEDTYADYPSKFYGSAAYSARSGDITAFKIEDKPEDIEMLVHEIGHSFGLQHTGTALINYSPIIVAKERYNEVAVTDRLTEATYDEYGEKSTIMGSGYLKNDYPDATIDYPYTLNTLQQQVLHKVTEKPLLQETFIMLDGSISVHAPYKQITYIELANELTLYDESTDNTHEYTSIAVVPSSNVHPSIKETDRLEVYGLNGSLTVFLGYITTNTYNKTVLRFDGQTVTIAASNKEVRIASNTM